MDARRPSPGGRVFTAIGCIKNLQKENDLGGRGKKKSKLLDKINSPLSSFEIQFFRLL